MQNLTEKQIMSFKTTVNWVFNDKCYSVIGYFDWKIGIFQVTVVRVSCILKTYTLLDASSRYFKSLAEIFLKHNGYDFISVFCFELIYFLALAKK